MAISGNDWSMMNCSCYISSYQTACETPDNAPANRHDILRSRLLEVESISLPH